MPTTPPKPGKHPSIRATFLIGLEKFSTDIANITAETKEITILVTDYKNSPAGPAPTTILQRIDTLKNDHNRLKEQLNTYYVWYDQLAGRGQLKDSMFVPKKYHVTEVKGQLRAFLEQWHALRRERKSIEAELNVKSEDDADAIQATR